MLMTKRATHNIIVLKRGAHVLNSAFKHTKLIEEFPPPLIQTSDEAGRYETLPKPHESCDSAEGFSWTAVSRGCDVEFAAAAA